MVRVETDGPQSTVASFAAEDEAIASRSAARLLITGSTQRGIETLARRIHGAGQRAKFPFVGVSARDFPTAAEAFAERCSGFLDAAAGGSMLIGSVEDLPPLVQDELLELLDKLELTRYHLGAVRLISGTTVSLLDRVTAGAFSARLFYRLNVIHLSACGPPLTPSLLDTPIKSQAF